MAGYKYGGARTPLQIIQASLDRQLETNQQLRDRLDEARAELRELRKDKNRLQARIADLKKHRPQAPPEPPPTPRDEAEQRLRAAAHEASTLWHDTRTRRAANEIDQHNKRHRKVAA